MHVGCKVCYVCNLPGTYLQLDPAERKLVHIKCDPKKESTRGRKAQPKESDKDFDKRILGVDKGTLTSGSPVHPEGDEAIRRVSNERSVIDQREDRDESLGNAVDIGTRLRSERLVGSGQGDGPVLRDPEKSPR